MDELSTLKEELKKANKLFFMALYRRKRAKQALENYILSNSEPVPELIQQTELPL